MRALVSKLVSLSALACLGGCATVTPDRRGHLADPMMSLQDSPLEAYRKQKMYTSREAAAGGDGTPAGGGCGCQ